MSEFFKNIPQIKFEGKDSKNLWAFKYYNPEASVMGKKMSEHLPFAMAWWHNLGANRTRAAESGGSKSRTVLFNQKC